MSPHLYLACFTTPAKLRDLFERVGVPFSGIKRIGDHNAFLESFPRHLNGTEVKIIVDPYFTPEGRVRFLEIKWN